jgi:hypothetical protein
MHGLMKGRRSERREKWNEKKRNENKCGTNNRLNLLNAELNPIRYLLALVGARHIDHVSRIRVKGRKKFNVT